MRSPPYTTVFSDTTSRCGSEATPKAAFFRYLVGRYRVWLIQHHISKPPHPLGHRRVGGEEANELGAGLLGVR